MKIQNLLALGFVVALSACSAKDKAKNPIPTPPVAGPGADELKPGEQARDQIAFEGNRLAPREFDVEEYRLNMTPTREGAKVRVDASVAIDLTAIKTLRTLVLDAHIDAVSAVTATQTIASHAFDLDKGTLTINFAEDLLAGAKTTITVRYVVMADTDRSGMFSYQPDPANDPNPVATLYTGSEPRRARQWMPSQDRPDDRARIETRFTMPINEKLVANGLLVQDEVVEGKRVMAYRTEFAIPTYVMAFAVADFQIAKRTWRGKEISIWSRNGLPVDASGLLDETERQLDFISERLGLYPWEKYAIVLLPDFGGGMENVSITFNDETRSSVADHPYDRSLMAHELGHQWFGDWVTVEGWDDLWIKEGMATLIAAEAFRPFEKTESGKTRLTGDFFSFTKGEAILDPKLPPERKYHSGPYDRAGWFLNQLRVKVGNDRFWATLRKLLDTHALGTINTEQFLAHFAEALGPAGVERARGALLAHEVPHLNISDADQQGNVRVELLDPQNTMLVPLELAVIGLQYEAPARGVLRLGADSGSMSATVSKAGPGTVAAFDRDDVHPEFYYFQVTGEGNEARVTDEDNARLAALIVPVGLTELRRWIDRSTDSEKFMALKLQSAPGWDSLTTSADWLRLYDAAATPFTQGLALGLGCAVEENEGFTDKENQRALLAERLGNLPVATIPWEQTPFMACNDIAEQTFAVHLETMRADPAHGLLNDRTVSFLMNFDPEIAPETGRDAWTKLAAGGSTLRVRNAAKRVVKRLGPDGGSGQGDE